MAARMPGADRRAEDVPADATLILCEPGTGKVLAYVAARGSGPADGLAALDTLAAVLVMLPPGAHPIPVN